MSLPLIWLAAGAGLIAFEALTAPGLGIFLAGLGAFVTAFFLEAGWIDAAQIGTQFICFFASTTLFAILLWKPLQRFRTSKPSSHKVMDMVGGHAVVAKGGLKKGEIGQVSWSGTLLNAQLDSHSAESSLPEGVQVVIRSVSGNTVTVFPVIL